MKSNFIIFFFNIGLILSYYSLKLNKIYLPQLSHKGTVTITNETIKNLTEEELEDLEEYIDLPLNTSEMNILNESYIKTKNIKSELYTIDTYLGSEKQQFRLLLSTFDDISSIASMECHSCNVINKYNTSLSISNINISEVKNDRTKILVIQYLRILY